MSSRLSKPVKRAAQLLVLAFVIHVFVVPQIGGARRALTVLGSVDPWLLGLAVVLETLSLAAYAWMTRALLGEANRPGFGVVFGAVVASTGTNHVVPGGVATTAAVNYRLLGRAGVPAGELGFALGTQAIGSAVVLNVILWCALVASIPASGFQPVYATAAAVGVVVIGAFGIAVTTMLRGRERLADLIARAAGRLPRVDAQAVRSAMLNIADQVRALAEDRRRLRTVIIFAAGNWLLDAAALWVVVAAFGAAPGVIGLLVAYGLANVMAAIPVSPGGLGIVEAVLIPTLVGFGTPRAEAAIAVVAYRLVNFWLPIPAGAISYLAVERVVGAEDRRGFRAELERLFRRVSSHRSTMPAALPPRSDPGG
jgi:hypothetical protein